MSKYFTNNFLFVSTVFTLVLLIVITDPMFLWLHHGVLNSYEPSLLEPTFYWLIGISVCSLILFFQSRIFFQKWSRKIFLWFVPLGLVITFTTDVYGGIPQPSRGDVAGWFSMLLVLITFVFILVQRFYFKIK